MKSKDKPSILDHIEAVVVDFLATKNLVFEKKDKEKATKALAVSVQMFHFVHSDRKVLSQNESSKFNTLILAGIKHVIVEKSNPPINSNLKSSILVLISRRVKVTMGCGPVLTNVLNITVAQWLAMPFLTILTTQLV